MTVVLRLYLSMTREGMRKKKQQVSSFHSFGILRLIFSSCSIAPCSSSSASIFFFSNSTQDAWHQRLNFSTFFFYRSFLSSPTDSFFPLCHLRKENMNTEEKKKSDEVISKHSSSLTSAFRLNAQKKNQNNFYFFF